jgi:hypothetical protein
LLGIVKRLSRRGKVRRRVGVQNFGGISERLKKEPHEIWILLNGGRYVIARIFEVFSHQPHKHLQDNCHLYPTLGRIALDVLPIQASSVPCKHLFSAGKHIATAC